MKDRRKAREERELRGAIRAVEGRRSNIVVYVAAAATLIVVVLAIKMSLETRGASGGAEAMPGSGLVSAQGALPTMTLEECNAAAVQNQMGSTWGPGPGGCFLISPDGSQVTKIGEVAP